MSIIGNTGISSPVADLGIDKPSGGEGGRRRTQTASYALEGFGGMLPPETFLNLRPQMMYSGSYFGLFFLTYSRHKKAPRII